MPQGRQHTLCAIRAVGLSAVARRRPPALHSRALLLYGADLTDVAMFMPPAPARAADLSPVRLPWWLTAFVLVASLATVVGCSREAAPPGIALELEKPDSWSYVTATATPARGNRIRFDRAQLESALTGGNADPRVALLKYPHPHAGTNPTLGVNVNRDQALTGSDPSEYLTRLVAEAQRGSSKRFDTLAPITPLRIAGHAAARTVLAAEQDAGAIVPALRLTIVVVLVDDWSFMIASSSPSAGEDDASGEFEQIIASLAFPATQ